MTDQGAQLIVDVACITMKLTSFSLRTRGLANALYIGAHYLSDVTAEAVAKLLKVHALLQRLYLCTTA